MREWKGKEKKGKPYVREKNRCEKKGREKEQVGKNARKEGRS